MVVLRKKCREEVARRPCHGPYAISRIFAVSSLRKFLSRQAILVKWRMVIGTHGGIENSSETSCRVVGASPTTWQRNGFVTHS